MLTVFGNNLDSVAKPGLEVSMVYRGNVVGVFDTVSFSFGIFAYSGFVQNVKTV